MICQLIKENDLLFEFKNVKQIRRQRVPLGIQALSDKESAEEHDFQKLLTITGPKVFFVSLDLAISK